MTKWRSLGLAAAAVLSIATAAAAGEADVVGVKAMPDADGTWRFAVAVRHADEGWDHYADRFEVLAPNGTVLGTRVLLHPHETEQPFTRTLTGVTIPKGIDIVEVRAHDKVHGYGGETMRVELKR